jgi:hypothetical protein
MKLSDCGGHFALDAINCLPGTSIAPCRTVMDNTISACVIHGLSYTGGPDRISSQPAKRIPPAPLYQEQHIDVNSTVSGGGCMSGVCSGASSSAWEARNKRQWEQHVGRILSRAARVN